MKFSFDIPDEDLIDGDGESFMDMVQAAAVQEAVNQIYRYETQPNYYKSAMAKEIERVVEQNKDVIIDRVVDHVSTSIERKRKLMELTPKASDLAAIEKENVQYFEGLVMKAIAKKFK